MKPLSRIVACALLSAVVLGCSKPKSAQTKEEKIVPKATVTSDQMLEDYKKNEIAADQKYKNNPIQITGKVTAIKKTPLLGYYIGLGTPHEDQMYDVMCYLLKDDAAVEKRAVNLKEGDTVTLVGMCEGKAGGFMLVLRHCFFPD